MLSKIKKTCIFTLIIVIIVVICFIFVMKLPLTRSNIDNKLDLKTNEQNNDNNLENDNSYYLHKSELETPNQEKCYYAQAIALEGLNENEKIYIKKELSYLHSKIEYSLLDNVTTLKESECEYWDYFLDSDPEVGQFTAILIKMEELSKYIKNDNIKMDFNTAHELWKLGMEEHDIANLFKAHEIIHDYDYWVYNTPLQLNFPAPDWAGIKIYFR